MTTRQRLRGTDIAIFISFPAVAVLSFSFLLIHRQLGRLAGMLLFMALVIAEASFIVLPLWVVLHIVFNRGRSYVEILWTQSLLAGAWLAIGVFLSLADSVGDRGATLIAALAGGTIALTPYTVRRLRSSSGRTPTG